MKCRYMTKRELTLMADRRFDICRHFHGMNDFGAASEEEKKRYGSIYSRSRTYSAECYAKEDKVKCTRKGICVRFTKER